MQNGSLTSAARSKAIETDIRTLKGQQIVTRVVNLEEEPLARHGPSSTQRRLTSSAVMALNDVRSIRQI
jgi:hypothetical protein